MKKSLTLSAGEIAALKETVQHALPYLRRALAKATSSERLELETVIARFDAMLS